MVHKGGSRPGDPSLFAFFNPPVVMGMKSVPNITYTPAPSRASRIERHVHVNWPTRAMHARLQLASLVFLDSGFARLGARPVAMGAENAPHRPGVDGNGLVLS